jgi:ADP-ribosylglycohydrolase
MTILMPDHNVRLALARRSLEGLSLGDAFGETFFYPNFTTRIEQRQTFNKTPWPYTDDTEMALSIFEVLSDVGTIDEDLLAFKFGDRYHRNPNRGYGGTAHRILRTIASGAHFSRIAPIAFDGQGSMGNGSAMRIGPLGAYFSSDPPEITAQQANRSAVVTHAHPEGIAGAIATALAAAWVARHSPITEARWHPEMLDFVIDHTPDSQTRDRLLHARDFQPSCSVMTAAAVLGNGSKVTCPDTVPFALWCASHTLHDYAESLWKTVSAEGDRDTTCAIVGSITILSAPPETVPVDWLVAREPLPF